MRDVSTANSETGSKATNMTSHATRFARHSWGKGWLEGKQTLYLSLARNAIWLVLLKVGLYLRSIIAKLSDADLSNFLSMSVLKEGFIVGMAQLSFLAFSSLQCSSETR